MISDEVNVSAKGRRIEHKAEKNWVIMLKAQEQHSKAVSVTIDILNRPNHLILMQNL